MSRALVAALLVLAACAVQAEGLDTTLSLRGDAWTGNRRLDDAGPVGRASLWGRATLDLAAAGRVVADGWAGAQTGAEVPGQRARVRELYWRADTGPLRWTLGRQNIVWGRADGLNPTDSFAVRDFTLLVPEDGEQRRGTDALRAAWDLGTATLTAVWAPRAGGNTIPLQPLPQVIYDVQRPGRVNQAALKLDWAGEGIDGSVSYFHGTDPMPDLAIAGLGPAGLTIAVQHHPLRVLGADLSLTRNGVVWRAEAAAMQTDNRGTQDFERKRGRFWLIAGGEWTLAEGTTLGLQASFQQVRGWQSPDTVPDPIARSVAWRQAAIANQTSARQAGVLWRLATRLRNDTVTAETSGAWMGSPGSVLWRNKLTWSATDHLQVLAGTEHFYGRDASLWGQLRSNRLAFVQLRYGW